MACPGNDSLTRLVDGSAEAVEAAALREHIASCPECAQLYSVLELRSTVEPPGALSATLPAGALAETPPQPSERHGVGPVDAIADAVVAARADTEPPPGTSLEPRPGLVLGQRYRLERKLGEGGMGTVWAAEHVGSGQRVALKLIRQGYAARPAMRRRMLREARAASAVQHPNVVRVLDVFEADNGAPVLVMDLLEGETLRDVLQRSRHLGLGEIATVLLPAMAAVKSAHHAGVIHRDLKPDNLFLARGAGGRSEVRVLDFGLARLISADGNSSQLTRTGEMLGTPSYMSPEQSFGEGDLDERTDVWALGVILYECLAGQRPFDGGNFGQVMKRITTGQRTPLDQLVPDCPREVVGLVDSMLTVARSERLADLDQAIAVLGRFTDGTVEARVVRPRRVPGLAVAALLLAVGAGLAATVWRLAGSGRGAPSAVAASPVSPPTTGATAPPPRLPPPPGPPPTGAPNLAATAPSEGAAAVAPTLPAPVPAGSPAHGAARPRPGQPPRKGPAAVGEHPAAIPKDRERTGTGGVATEAPF